MDKSDKEAWKLIEKISLNQGWHSDKRRLTISSGKVKGMIERE